MLIPVGVVRWCFCLLHAIYTYIFVATQNFTALHNIFLMRLSVIVKHNIHLFDVCSMNFGERCVNVFFSFIFIK